MILKNNAVIILIIIIVILVGYTVFARQNSTRKIKDLTKKIEVQVDSIQNLHSRYESLEGRYEKIYNNLDSTKVKLAIFKKDIDSIMNSNFHDLEQLRTSVKEILKNQGTFTEMDTSDDDHFRFK